jgi:replicative DNA helicase
LSLTNACRSLKILANELKIPIILTSSLNSFREKMSDKRPQLSDLTAIAGNAIDIADTVLLIHRESLYCEKCLKHDNSCKAGHNQTAELIIAKQRNGGTGTINITFLDEFTRFENPKIDI